MSGNIHTHANTGQHPDANDRLRNERGRHADHAFGDVHGGQAQVRGKLDSLGIPGLHGTESPTDALRTNPNAPSTGADFLRQPHNAERQGTAERNEDPRGRDRKIRYSADHGHDHAPGAHAPTADEGDNPSVNGWAPLEAGGLAAGIGVAGGLAASGFMPTMPAALQGSMLHTVTSNTLVPLWEAAGSAAIYAGEVTTSVLSSFVSAFSTSGGANVAAFGAGAVGGPVMAVLGSAIGGTALLWGLGKLRRTVINMYRRERNEPELPGGFGRNIGHGLKLFTDPFRLAGKALVGTKRFFLGKKGEHSGMYKTGARFFGWFDKPGGKFAAAAAGIPFGIAVMAGGAAAPLLAIPAVPLVGGWAIRKAYNFFKDGGGGGAHAHGHDDHGGGHH